MQKKKRPAYEAAYAALIYQERIRDILISFKYQQKTGYRRALAAILLELYQRVYSQISFDAIVPIPVHPQRIKERGYNQAKMLSQIVAKETRIDHLPQLLRREKETPPLAKLGRKERIKVLNGVFVADPTAEGLRILLIDDIFTTGATAEMCSRALLRQNAQSVHYLAVAAGRALP